MSGRPITCLYMGQIRHGKESAVLRNMPIIAIEAGGVICIDLGTAVVSYYRKFEGSAWIRGHHDLNSPEVQAMLAAMALLEVT